MNKILFAAAVCFAVSAPLAVAADYEAGKKKAEEVCQACHGPQGDKPITPDIPILAGQYPDYLVHALKAYKAGTRQNVMMSPMAQPLSEEDMANVAEYFSQQQGLYVKY